MEIFQTLRENMRKHFRLEYLGQLLQHKCDKQQFQIHRDDIVTFGNVFRKRTFWPLTKGLEIYTGNDGNIRISKWKTSVGGIIRHFVKHNVVECNSQALNILPFNTFTSAPGLPIVQHVLNFPISD